MVPVNEVEMKLGDRLAALRAGGTLTAEGGGEAEGGGDLTPPGFGLRVGEEAQ